MPHHGTPSDLSGAVSSVNGQAGTVVLSAADVSAQPVDSDLTAIAALTTTSYGRAVLALANAAALRTAAGLGTAAVAATTDFDAAGAAAAVAAASQPIDSDLTAIAALATTSFGRSFLALANAAAGRTALALGTIATQSASSVSITGGSITGITDLAVADGGTAASDVKTARFNLQIGTAVAVADANKIVGAGEFVILYTSITTPRGVTLPAANSLNAGESIVVADQSGSVSSTNTITVNRGGSDLINNGTGGDVMNVSYSIRRYFSDGTSKWTTDQSGYQAVAGAGITLTNDNTAKTTTFTSKGVNYQELTTAGTATWTKPANALSVFVDIVGSGLGGGGGRAGAAGTARYGGGGGGGGGRKRVWMSPDDLGSTETMTVSAGGGGGTGGASGGANGQAGTNPSDTSFGAHVVVTGSVSFFAAVGGSSAAPSVTTGFGGLDTEITGSAIGQAVSGGLGIISGTSNGGGASAGLPGSGGAGGGIDASNVRRDGGGGGGGQPGATVTGGTGGSGSGGAGGNGTATTKKHQMGAGGGGGAASSSNATNGGVGGIGSAPGGGGGGGGATISGGTASGGNGGAGAPGCIRVWTYVGSGA